tara:strand:+ start:136 stop:408 length:273 start_codon:yes stop_codon:yes gene_type:complete
MSSIKRLIKWYPKWGMLSVLIIILMQGFRYLFVRQSKKHQNGWHTPIATELTQSMHNQKFRIIDMGHPLNLPLDVEGKNVHIDEDIYPLV